MGGEKGDSLPIRAPALDGEALARKVRERLRRRKEAAPGEDPARIPTLDFEAPLSEEDFLRFHLGVAARLAEIDIGDFEIVSKGGPLGGLEVFVKRTLWKLLRFYTFRLFSQQREFNSQAVEALRNHYRWTRAEIERLSREVGTLRAQREGREDGRER